MVVTPCLDPATLDAVTKPTLSYSNYSRAFIHAILGIDAPLLYQWERRGGWSKSTIAALPEREGPSFWDVKNNPDLFNDPDGWYDRELKQFFLDRRRHG